MTTSKEGNSREIWKPVVGYEGYLEATRSGNIRRLERVIQVSGGYTRRLPARTLSATPDKTTGYKRVSVRVNGGHERRYVHHLVALTFLGPPPGEVGCRAGCYQINHIDGNKINNAVDNLEWVLKRDNTAHAVDAGLISRGEGRPLAKLSKYDIIAIREEYQPGSVTQKALATKYDVAQSLISRIITRSLWRHV